MHLRQIIASSKTAVSVGKWQSGKVPRADFPMAKAAYGLGSSFQWCVITFTSLETECRVLVVVNAYKQKYEAILGAMGPNGLRILCTYEYHPSEPGWHCHATHDDADTLRHGAMRGPWIKRIPAARQPHRSSKYVRFQIGDKDAAIRFAIDRYRIWSKGQLL